MGSRGDAYDNAAAESFMATIKTELVHRQRFKSRHAARLAVFRYIEGFYNPHRRHSALGYRSPAEHEKMLRDDEALSCLRCLTRGCQRERQLQLHRRDVTRIGRARQSSSNQLMFCVWLSH